MSPRSVLIDTQVSATTQSVSATALSMSSQTMISPPLSRAQASTSSDNRSASGQAIFSVKPKRAAAWVHDTAMLLPSPDPADRVPGDRAAVLLERQDVGHQLARMGAVGQGVDHRHAGVFGELHELRMLGRADHDDVDVARQHARGVGDRLAAAEMRVDRRQHNGLAAELAHADLERDPGARRRRLEDHRQRLAGQRQHRIARLQLLFEADGRGRGSRAVPSASTMSRSRKWRGGLMTRPRPTRRRRKCGR